MANGTYMHGERNLYTWRTEITCVANGTYMHGERNLDKPAFHHRRCELACNTSVLTTTGLAAVLVTRMLSSTFSG